MLNAMTMSPANPSAPATRGNALAILLYPAQLPSLTTLLALSLSMLATLAPVVGLAIFLFIWAAALRYAAEVLEHSANGSRTAPEFATEPDGIGWSLLILQAFFLACILWLNWSVENAGWRWLGIAGIAFAQPAMLLTAVMNRDLGAALDPARIARVIAKLGVAYPPLILATIALAGAQHLLAGWIGRLPAVIGQPLIGFVMFYAMVMYFHLLGRLAYSHHERLGFVPVPEFVLRPEDRHAPLLARVEHLVEAGETAQAARELGHCLASEPHATEAMHARYRELLAQTSDIDAMQAHARERIAQLNAAGADREALNLLREALARDPQFRPAAAGQAMQLAQAAERSGQHDLLLTLLRDFAARYPRDPDGPASALKAAQILIDRHSDIAGARETLHAALAGYYGPPDCATLQQRLSDLDRMSRKLAGGSQASTTRTR
jgi:hypothetical protein